MKFPQSDWTLFRTRLPEWQEAHIQKLIASYQALLAAPVKASDKFHTLERRLQEDRRSPAVDARMTESLLLTHMVGLYYAGTITWDDISLFSPQLQKAVHHILTVNGDKPE